jgi:ABC-type nitrate/sulfonate/bicarbonate transport system substrate-binding protein
MRTQPKFVRATALLAMAVALAGSAWSQAKRQVTIAISSPTIPAAGARIAKEMGLFEKHGLDAKITPMDNASVATMGLISGSLDFTTTGPSDIVVSQARGQDLVAISSVYGGFAGVLVLSKATVEKLKVSPTAPIAQRLKALDGLVIASPSATSTYTFAYKSAAEAAGAKIRFTYMAQPAMVAALETGAIQGIIAGSPVYAKPIINGSGVMWISGPKRELPAEFTPANAVTVNTKREFATANPDVIKRMTAVFADLSKAVEDRPADVKAALSKLYPELDARTIDLLWATESLGFNAKPLTSADMAREISFVKSSGIPMPAGAKLDPDAMVFR